MTMLAQYHIARQALAEATSITSVMSMREEMAHIKLYAKHIRDRSLMADALAFQLRCERRLGILLDAAREAGELHARGRRGKIAADADADALPPATLQEIGVDKKLSAKAQKAAALTDDAFEAVIERVRDNLRAGGSMMVDPIQAATKAAEVAARRQAHADRTMTGATVADLGKLALSGFRPKLIYLDPPWHFETHSDVGDDRSASTHYTTGLIDRIMQDLSALRDIAGEDCVLMPWIVDWGMHQALDLIAALGFEFKTVAFTWAKQTSSKDGWHMGQGFWTRANPEMCLLATRGKPKRLHADVQQLIVAPVMEHSRKPDEAYDRIERLVEGPYLECYARRPRKGWVSWGNELAFTGEAA